MSALTRRRCAPRKGRHMLISDTAKKVTAHILHGNCLDVLQTLDSASVQTCVTSPPYFGLRDYGTAQWEGGDRECDHLNGLLCSSSSTLNGGKGVGDREKIRLTGMPYKLRCAKCGAVRVDSQIGLEETPAEYVSKLVAVFREVKRVLKDDGTLWLNLGDSYCNSNGYARAQPEYQRQGRNDAPANDRSLDALHNAGLKTKDLIGIPWRVAFALQADGWYLRQDIIWHKPNPMPESVKDRCTKAHEYIFLLSKSAKYFYDADAIREAHKRIWNESNGGNLADVGHKKNGKFETKSSHPNGYPMPHELGANKRSVWTIATKPYTEAHFATFPIELPEICIKAGSREGDTVLDPFNGAASTGVAALLNGREYVGIELNPEYVALSKTRLTRIHPLFAEVRTETTAHSDIAEG